MIRPSSRLARRSSALRFRPRLDALEGRALLATLVVTSPADSGDGTLRNAVDTAAPGDTITFDASLDGQTITLTSGEVVDPGKSLTIQGPGADKLTISAGGNSKVLVFYSPTGATFDAAVSGLTIADGYSPYSGGGMLTVGANLTVCGVVFRDNVSASQGGGLDVATVYGAPAPGNTATIIDSQFLNNTALFGGGYQSYGVTVDIRGSTFSGNTGTIRAGGLITGNSSLSVSDSTFLNNVGGGLDHFAGFTPQTDRLDISGSLFAGNTRSNGFGGAVFNGGGNATISGSTFRDNATTDAYYPQGGAVALESGVSASVDGSTFEGNRAENPNAWEAGGGGLFIEDIQHVSVTNSTFRDNLARGTYAYGGGASRTVVYGSYFQPQDTTFSGDTFVDNRAVATVTNAGGGGLNLGGVLGTTTISDSLFSGNRAIGEDRATNFGAFARGGAIEADGTYGYPPSALSISDTDFSDNAALGGSGPAGGFADGGALVLGGFDSATITGGSFTNNAAVGGVSTAPQTGGYSGLAYGGAIREFYGSSLAVTGTSLVGNSALGGAGSLGGDGGIASGGAVVGDGNFTDVTFNKNQAIGGAGGSAVDGGTGGRGGDAKGGAVAGSGTFQNVRFLHNSALGGAGGSGGATGTGGAGGDAYGGGLFNAFGPVTVLDSLFVQNEAIGGAGGSGLIAGADGGGYGGGIAVLGGPLTLNKKTKFVKNRASTAGDDIYPVPAP